MPYSHLFLLFVLLVGFMPTALGAAAGLSPVNKSVDVDKAWNPWPAADDIVLPMPCEGKMVFRAVEIPVRGLLYDKKFIMGLNDAKDSGRDMYERRYDGHISAPFARKDLPASWQQGLPADNAATLFYYFLAKYEVSQWQWKAVMEDACPREVTVADIAPKTDITWLEMQQFLYKYTEWLLQNHKSALPVFADNDKDIAYLRLPTEAEWEFAAKGGIRVPEEHRNQEDFYPLQEYGKVGKAAERGDWKLQDFAIYQGGGSSVSKAQPIGSRKPNPLLLYDMAGNAREAVQSFFHFTVAEQSGGATVRRLHGSAGGLVSKGGSFLNGEESVLPGSRTEIPLFQEKGAYKMRDLGFRPVISGINTPASGSRLGLLEKENNAMASSSAAPSRTVADPSLPDLPMLPSLPQLPAGIAAAEDKPVKLDPSGELVAELDKIAGAARSSVMKDNLHKYRAMVADKLAALERQQEDVTLGIMRSALYQAEGLRNTAFRILRAERDIDDEVTKVLAANKHITKPGQRKEAEQALQKQLVRAKQIMDSFIAMLNSSSNNYKQDVESLAKEKTGVLERGFTVLQMEYAGEDLLSAHMRENMQALHKHLAQVRGRGMGSLSKEQIWRDIIPKSLLASKALSK